MKKQRICLAVNALVKNGVTKVLSILLDNIDYDKYNVTVLLTKKLPKSREINKRARIIETSSDYSNGIIDKINNIRELHKILKKENFDVVIALGDFAAMYVILGATGTKSDIIVSERNDPNREPDKKIFRKLRDLIYRKAKAIVCQTSDAAAYYSNIVKKRIVIYNPIDKALPVYHGERDKRIVNFCRIDSQKNLPLLIDSFVEFSKGFSGYTLEIYGDGPLKDDIQEYIDKCKMSKMIKLYPFCTDIHERIKKAAMFVSSSDFEGMSNSMLEAMAIGLPSVCTDCPIGGAHEIIQNEKNGLLVPTNDKTAMVKAMKKIASDPKFASLLSKESVKIRERLSQQRICNKWWKLFEQEIIR